MPRTLRVHFPGAIYHVTDRGVNRQPVFRDDADRRRFLAELRAALSRHQASLFSYCLMTNHLHLLIRVGEVPIGVMMRELLGSYSMYFNLTEGRVGHLFQGRYKAVLCKSGRQLVNTVAYIHMNPVEAGLVRHPREWAWCSHEELTSVRTDLLELAVLEESTGLAPAELRALYAERLALCLSEHEGAGLDDILASASARHGVTPEDIRDGRRGGDYTEVRREFIRRAAARGHDDSGIAAALGCSKAAVSLLRSRPPREVNKGSDPFVN